MTIATTNHVSYPQEQLSTTSVFSEAAAYGAGQRVLASLQVTAFLSLAAADVKKDEPDSPNASSFLEQDSTIDADASHRTSELSDEEIFDSMIDADTFVHMPPRSVRRVRVRIRSVQRGVPSTVDMD